MMAHTRCYFIPRYLEDRICSHDPNAAPKTGLVSEGFRITRNDVRSKSNKNTKNYVYNAKNRRRQPGSLVADSMNDATATKDLDVVGAWTLTDYFLRFCKDVLNRASFDGEGGDIKSTIHYYTRYNNAFFDGSQMIYGDGDDKVFEDFAQDPSVVFHELWHGVTDLTCRLVYQDQSGALNESLSDVFASIIMQWMNGESVDDASWLIGERCVIDIDDIPYALRSMADPGTAFVDHPYMGSDDQPQDMDHFDSSPQDNGGIHKNSGIPNHAFYLFSKSIGGFSWDIPCKIWYKTITTPGLVSPNSTFMEFAQATLTTAGELYTSTQPSIVDKLRRAWQIVKVL